MMKKIFSVLVLSFAACAVYAGGYRVALQGQKALAMGHTGVAVVNSAELAFFNPAGIVFMENKLSIAAGASAIFSNIKYQNSDTGEAFETDNPVGTPLNFYATYQITEWFGAGLAVYTPYGSTVEWEENWSGGDLVNSISLSAVYINPIVSLKLTPEFSIGGGPIYATGGVNFNRNISNSPDIDTGEIPNIELDASGVDNWGWTFSAMFRPSENFTMGVNYRSKIKLTAEDGDVTYNNVNLEDQTFTATLPLPAELSFGFSFNATSKLLIAAEFNRQYWATYESLTINFADGSSSINLRDYEDSTTYRLGLQYDLNDKFDLRAGYYFDETPVRSGLFAPETPRSDAHGFTTGLSFNVTEKLSIDASFFYLYFPEIDESYDSDPTDTVERFYGSYKTLASSVGLGLTYQL